MATAKKSTPRKAAKKTASRTTAKTGAGEPPKVTVHSRTLRGVPKHDDPRLVALDLLETHVAMLRREIEQANTSASRREELLTTAGRCLGVMWFGDPRDDDNDQRDRAIIMLGLARHATYLGPKAFWPKGDDGEVLPVTHPVRQAERARRETMAVGAVQRDCGMVFRRPLDPELVLTALRAHHNKGGRRGAAQTVNQAIGALLRSVGLACSSRAIDASRTWVRRATKPA